jgi:pimeloyl-ACP methyl ester carboxylesterase
MTSTRIPPAPAATAAASHRPLRSALAVVLATLGGLRGHGADLASMRRSLPVGGTQPGRISYLAAGVPGGARLVMVHGTPGSATGWGAYLRRPPPGFEVVALDRPGFGASDPAAALTSLAAQAAAVAAVLPAAGGGAVLLGHSLGGAIAARVAAEHPGRVAALILLAAALDPALERVHPLQRLGGWAPVRTLLPRSIRNANAELLGLRAELVELERCLARIRCPVFIVHGTDDDLVPPANVSFVQRRLTAAASVRTVLLPGRNHFLPWNAELDVRRAIEAARQPPC